MVGSLVTASLQGALLVVCWKSQSEGLNYTHWKRGRERERERELSLKAPRVRARESEKMTEVHGGGRLSLFHISVYLSLSIPLSLFSLARPVQGVHDWKTLRGYLFDWKWCSKMMGHIFLLPLSELFFSSLEAKFLSPSFHFGPSTNLSFFLSTLKREPVNLWQGKLNSIHH